ncbi:hypothetical protein [Macrococcus lamae]|uniref:Cthe-2314-like HEPN domain-containing protein n=1 Tax=Macrococcus lamae TaxID=198484 RepID=A0A4V3BEW1_9STAP|nr:hypothetical protein [Macrococcus lamae]TDM10447.1 hypothetical protein ERX29_07190 [Macrococcus lamae]
MKIDIFNNHDGINKHAFLNWRFTFKDRPSLFDTMSEAYYESTNILVNECINDNSDKKADSLIFPILFSLNHYIELRLKSIIAYFYLLESDNDHISNIKNNPFSSHNISELMSIVVKLLNHTNLYKIEKDLKRFKQTNSYISQLNEYQIFKISPHMDFSRYPMNKSEKTYFYAETYENVTISLTNLKEIFSLVADELNGLYYQLEYIHELKKESDAIELEIMNQYQE